MRNRNLVVLAFAGLTAVGAAAEEWCATGRANDLRVRALHERVRERRTLDAEAVAPPAVLRDGAFYLQADEATLPGHRPFDLEGVSLVFEPRDGGRFAIRREALLYREPVSAPVHDFSSGPRTIERALPFLFPAFGRQVAMVYVTALNTIQFDPPVETAVGQIRTIDATVHPQAILSPLMMGSRKPSRLALPELFIEETDSSVFITWRSSAGPAFGYDVQAELRRDGAIVYSYRSLSNVQWGAPIVSRGFDPAALARTVLGSVFDAGGDIATTLPANLRPLLDVRGIEIVRLDNSDLTSISVRFAAPIDVSHLGPDDGALYRFFWGDGSGQVEIRRNRIRAFLPGATSWVEDSPMVRIEGNDLELLLELPDTSPRVRTVGVATYALPSYRSADSAAGSVPFTPASRRLATDLSSVPASQELPLPIFEPFVLGGLDVFAVWDRLRASHPFSNEQVDGVLIFQTMFTDLIFYAGAYATGGNPQVDGIAETWEEFGRDAPRQPSLMHMNQLTFGYNSAPQTASNVMLHEFGHRWLYFFNIEENGSASNALNPAGAHPAGYVHTPAAFSVSGEAEEASVMGGAFFSREPYGRFKARVLNYGFSWTDLYLMGLATPAEVPPWYYLAETDPALPQAYWPVDGVVVRGEKRDVALQQIVAVHGDRNPPRATAQRAFRTVFVLLTEEGREATAEEVAKLNEWRALFEANFSTATGGRGDVTTTVLPPVRRRAVR